MIKFDGWFRRRTLLVPNLIFGVHRHYFRRLKIWKWSDKGVWNDSFSFHFVGLTITNILDLSIWRLRFKQLYVHVQQTQRSDHYNPFPLQAKFRQCRCKFSLWRNFSGCEISAGWQRNFVWLNENSRALWRNFVLKFRRIFARTKNEKHRISFAFLLRSSVVWVFIVTKSE